VTTYNNVQAQTQASEPLTTSLVTALDRNLYALLEGDPTATGFAQLQEPGIQDLAVTPSKIEPVTAPTSTATGVFDDAVPVSTIHAAVISRTSTTAVYQNADQTIARDGSYTFFMASYMTRSSGNMIVKNSLVVNGSAVATTIYSSGSVYTAQVTVNNLSVGDVWFIKNERVSGTGTVSSNTSAVCLISEETSNDELYIDRGLWQVFGTSTANYFNTVQPTFDFRDFSNYTGSSTHWFDLLSIVGTQQPDSSMQILTI
jgi:hypothetical protein